MTADKILSAISVTRESGMHDHARSPATYARTFRPAALHTYSYMVHEGCRIVVVTLTPNEAGELFSRRGRSET